MTTTEIRKILESPYDRKVWKNFLQTQFTNNKMNAEDRPIILSDTSVTEQCHSLGYYEIDTYTKIGIFEVQLNDKVNLTRNRVGLRNLIKNITQQLAGAMVVFVQDDKWRFSYVSKRKVKNKETNTIEDKETAPKRYTYLFGNGEKALTAAQRFDKLIQKQRENLFQNLTLKDFEDAFSVEKLSKEFFAKYKDIYEDFVEFITGKRFVKKGSKWTETTTHEANYQLRIHFDYDEKKARDFFKRMMGRIVFLYFIQKKGWLSCPIKIEDSGKNKNEINWGEGDQDFLYNLFINAKYKDSFYSDYLVPLFFNTLNNQDGKFEIDSSLFINHSRLIINNFFPYLNGGLFDKKQDVKYDKLALPSAIFEKLFKTFDEYNFTVHEDAPDDHTVAVDPEMLGHIFENLLEDNKDKGAFYTPKDIVHYMCRESLHNYIFTYTGNEENEDFKQRFQQYNDTYDLNLLDKEEIKQIDRALEDVKICDPAIGSGAFPMGLLHEIYHLKIPIEDAKGLKAKSPADLKKHIIEESIYGVDIDNGAVDIARLRFWLSLVVDEIEPQPLPNLAFKIVCANTLIPLGKNTLSDLGGSQELARQLESIREKYFGAKKEEKKDLERQFTNLQNKLWSTANEWAKLEDKDIYLKILEFSPFEDKSCSWFDPLWMFGIKDGFDIVIGNPPYVSVKSLSNELKKTFNNIYETGKGRFNLFTIYLEKGHTLLKDKGYLTYIQPEGLFSNTEYRFIREYLYKKADILKICLFTKRVFAASVDTAIILFKNNLNTRNHNVLFDLDIDLNFSKKVNFMFANEDVEYIFPVKSNQVVDSIVLKNSILLSSIIEFQQGIIYSGISKEEIFSNEKKNEKFKKCLDGRDVLKYQLRWNEKEENKYIEYNRDKLHRPREERLYLADKKILLPRRATNIYGTIDNEQYYVLNTAYIGLLKKDDFLIEFILSLLNSSLFNYIYHTKYFGWQITIPALNSFLIPLINLDIQNKYKIIVDFLLLLSNKITIKLIYHISNERIASHFEDILNMMVYELYFEEHMKKVGIDVLQFVAPQLESLQGQPLENQIKNFYEWYQKPENQVRQRMLLIDTRSPDILAVINKS